MKKQLASSILIGIITLALPSIAFAAGQYGGCSEQYGGQCSNYQFSLKKYVKDPKTKNFVDSMGNKDTKFLPEDAVTYKITITNTGNEALKNITVEDEFPDLVAFVSGPGNFDNNTKILKFEVDTINPNESKDFLIQGKIASENKLPADQGLICVINKASLNAKGMVSTDNAQLCIEKQVLGQTKGGLKVFPAPRAEKTPPTGPEAVALIGLLPAAITGLLLRKKTK